jgi:hypothetical protein
MEEVPLFAMEVKKAGWGWKIAGIARDRRHRP